MKAIIVALLLAFPLAATARDAYNDVVYKCVKDGNVTYQEMPCGWSALGSDARKKELQVTVPFSDFCKDPTVSDKDALKRDCPPVTLPKDLK